MQWCNTSEQSWRGGGTQAPFTAKVSPLISWIIWCAQKMQIPKLGANPWKNLWRDLKTPSQQFEICKLESTCPCAFRRDGKAQVMGRLCVCERQKERERESQEKEKGRKKKKRERHTSLLVKEGKKLLSVPGALEVCLHFVFQYS